MFKIVLKHYQRSASWVLFSFFWVVGCNKISLSNGGSWEFLFLDILMAQHVIWMTSQIFHQPPTGWWFQPIWKNISQNGKLPQIGVKIENIWVATTSLQFPDIVLEESPPYLTPPWGAHQTSAKILVQLPPYRGLGNASNKHDGWLWKNQVSHVFSAMMIPTFDL